VALKFLPANSMDDPAALECVLHEAQSASAADHPNICTIHDIGSTDEGQPFIVMAHYEGQTLTEKLAHGPVETEEIVEIAAQIADALGAAHMGGIVHRDIKPANIFICSGGLVKVLDFGVASRLSEHTSAALMHRLDIPGRPVGTPNYMAPERILDMPVDPRSDLFSLGVLIYEMATGIRPFAGESTAETVINVLDNDPVPLTRLSPARPLGLERIVNKALAKHADERYQSASELGQALRGIGRLRRLSARRHAHARCGNYGGSHESIHNVPHAARSATR
jgi:serine/threonine protein kinase